jgi:DnaJ-class molecular chaperone
MGRFKTHRFVKGVMMRYMGYKHRQDIHTKREYLDCAACSGTGYQNPLDIDSVMCFKCMGAGSIEIKRNG